MEQTGVNEFPIKVTENAKNAFIKALKEEGEGVKSIRVSVRGGGCSGYQYNLDFEDEIRDDDHIMPLDDEFKLIVDPISGDMIKGTTIDFVSGLNGSGFKFNNPNAKRTCGCGHSFS
ncbi:MAG: iron-sulfur cluster assembly accessory protein [Deltaproteobacteria bacterium]|nr:iron-sulfur cluster assembly accessory protein [Deltaproteobacteria bacterium]